MAEVGVSSTSGQVLQSKGVSSTPAYSTATYPSTAGTIGNVLTSNGTNWLSQAPATGNSPPLQSTTLFDDFVGNIASNALGWTQNNSGTGAGALSTSDSGHPGVFQLQAGTVTNGDSWIFLANSNYGSTAAFTLGGGVIDMYWVVQIPILSNSSDRFNLSIGFGDGKGSGLQGFNNGVYFYYSDNTN